MAAIVVAVVGFTQYSAAQVAEEDTAPAATEEETAQGRYEAAIEAREEERQRIAAAEDRFAAEEPANARAPYLVSLDKPIAVEEAFEGFKAVPDVELTRFYTWLHSAESLFPVTGEHTANDVGWPDSGSAAIARHVVQRGDRFLTARLEALERAKMHPAEQGMVDQRALQDQHRETETLRNDVRRGVVMIYGFECVCSPSDLRALEGHIPNFRLRAVEIAAPQLRPVWPINPLRDKIIATGGHYGL